VIVRQSKTDSINSIWS